MSRRKLLQLEQVPFQIEFKIGHRGALALAGAGERQAWYKLANLQICGYRFL